MDQDGLRRLIREASAGGQSSQGTRLGPVIASPTVDERKRLAVRVMREWTDEIASADEAARNAGDLGRFPRVLEFAHLLAPRRLVDVLKKTREGGSAAARDSTREMLQECLAVLRRLGERSIA